MSTDYDVMTAEAIANLAFITQADKSSVTQVTEANRSLTNQLTASYEKLDAAFADITAFKWELAQLKASNFQNRLCRAPRIHRCYNQNYFWTHGWHIHDDHMSAM